MAFLTRQQPDNAWYMDTGVTSHLTNNSGNLPQMRQLPTPQFIMNDNGHRIPIQGFGHTLTPPPHPHFSLQNVLYAPNIIKNRISARSIRSAADGSGLNTSPTTSSSGGYQLIRAIEALLGILDANIKVLRKNLPMKLLFFLGDFYCATAFATVIGQTSDWDIISAGLAVAVVEGIGALMYRSIPLIDEARSLITMFNYWKTGLTLGLFLDSFKY
ncbi:hypothetical protein RND71_035792 [Anisodus tanguticus]|uniref:Retrovirus-related Pol polyprotein from transposon TNT 1-94-like beta-barrel domain-containing protein n=1 Tax=Anisodus tanguticus TaxID=243964 RepID=A0AAE1R5J0_9SOLA|nr:hypothetical protein RND71_035792 [Anisodus tanguticus]